MRWDALFDDLQGQMAASELLDLESEITERARLEIARITLIDRLRAATSRRITVDLAYGLQFSGAIRQIGSDWILLSEGSQSVVVLLRNIMAIEGLGAETLTASSLVRQNFRSLSSALRLLARDRAMVTIYLMVSDESRRRFHAVIDRVGEDHCDIAVVRDGEVRRQREVLVRKTIPFGAILAIASLREAHD